MQGAWKVGLLVVVFVVLLVGAYQVLGRSLFAPKTNLIYAELEDVTGVNQGAPVLMAGVPVGTVEQVSLTSPRTARLTLAIEEGHEIPSGSTVQVPTPLLGFGDNPVHIVPPAVLSGNLVQPGETLPGKRLAALEGILPDLDVTVEELNKTLVAAREVITDERLRNNLNRLIESGTTTLQRFGSLASSAESLVAQNRSAIASSMKSVQTAMLDVQKSAALARQLLEDPRWSEKATELLDSMNLTVNKANEVLGSVDGLINDPNIRQPIHETLANAKTITDSGTRIAASAEKITEEGIVISKNITELTVKANELAEEARTVLQKLQDFFQRVPSTGGLRGLEVGMDLLRESKPDRWRTDVVAKLPIKGGSAHLGVYDAFEGNKLNLQVGKSFAGGSEYRYGIYSSKPGIGVDFKLARNLTFKGDLYDINDPRLDLGVRYEFKDGLLGWLGFNRVFGGGNAFFAGLGFRK
jgi:phospholipid/cholesterol/gamma-HCH transport system substrate-binding protein